MVTIDEKQAETFSKYPWQITVIVLCAVVSMLAIGYVQLNTFIRTDLMDMHIKTNAVMENSTQAIKDFIFYQKYEQPKAVYKK